MLIIREPEMNDHQIQEQGEQERNLGLPSHNRDTEIPEKRVEDPPIRDNGSKDLLEPLTDEEEGELMDDEDFEKMIELYTDPEPEIAFVENTDDLMEDEEQEMERARLEREKSSKMEKKETKGTEANASDPTVPVPTANKIPNSQKGKDADTRPTRNTTGQASRERGDKEERAITEKKRRRTPRSPDLFPEPFFHGGGDAVIPGCWKTGPAISSFLSSGGTLSQLLKKFLGNDSQYVQQGGGGGGSWSAPFKTWQSIYNYDITDGLVDEEERKLVLGGEVALSSEQADPAVLDSRTAMAACLCVF
ncbi:hypothetical protein Bca52824_018266 [Brassica carinata]|uniref:beta-N-acetylhexosaminidase n=1 Tax=Brassica carinata TaxID=52824 RepID=A0A8X8AW88_BRACI|nr:hypothetical protein Bca52824_018266 [Brassica carinata]